MDFFMELLLFLVQKWEKENIP
uniref:Uncharacterized protein n=1 Tax=Anguilla anguilla TaxID=7936 RepID=A0A0E9UWS3_ANGAN